MHFCDKICVANDMNNKLIISHVADIDGLGCVVLFKILFSSSDYILCDLKDLTNIIKELTISNKYREYDEIFITDLPIRMELIEFINNNEELKSRIKHFDHHESEIENNKIDFINEVPIKNEVLTCATSLLYDYLRENYNASFLFNKTTIKFVEATRSRDTWDFRVNGNVDANKMEVIHSYYGNDSYILKYVNVLKYNLDLFDDNDEILVKNDLEKQEFYLKVCNMNLITFKLDNYMVGAVIIEDYRSEVGNYLSSIHPELDYILILDFFRNSFSFRTVNDNIDLSLIAKMYEKNGGGHKKAAGMSITSENIWLVEKIIKHFNRKIKEDINV